MRGSPEDRYAPVHPPKKENSQRSDSGGASIKRVTVSMQNGRWYVALGMESIIPLVPEKKQIPLSEIMAGDAGLKEFLIYGNMDHTEFAKNKISSILL